MSFLPKCIVLDLDNTLWGGEVGEVGPEGILVDQDNGRSFLEIQAMAKSARAAGVLLAVCSKNDHENAIRPFLERPEMILKLEDFSVFIANWENKASNIEAIAKSLEIGIDSLAFVDDSPAERELVRQKLPAVFVPEISTNVHEISQVLAISRLFHRTNITEDDLKRASYYEANANRNQQKLEYADIGEYLTSLNMVATEKSLDEEILSRCTQLFARTNQFNLTGLRPTEAELRDRISDPESLVKLFSLSDKFGENGWVSAFIIRIDDKVAILENWVMSCRVLGRNFENAIFNSLVKELQLNGIERLEAKFIKTPRNKKVSNLLEILGMEPSGDENSFGLKLPFEPQSETKITFSN